jgi:hypothetical protein
MVPRITGSASRAVYILLCACVLPACDSSIVRSGSADWSVANGTAYDQATLDPGNAKTLIVPQNAKVTATSTDGRVHLYLKKKLAWMGHPQLPADIRYERYKMGCATHRDGPVLTLATFGEWDSVKEGGATIALAIIVPPGLTVETRDGLSGQDSPVEIQEPIFDSLQSRPWNDGWIKVKDQPDPSLGSGRF